jgi:hypothetical protein
MGSAEAMTKLQNLSEDRAKRVFALVEDSAVLEALEDAEDVMDAGIALAEVEEANSRLFRFSVPLRVRLSRHVAPHGVLVVWAAIDMGVNRHVARRANM